jgi:uncharacterized membrane protein YczE
MDPVMQATFSQMAIEEKANPRQAGPVTTTTNRSPRPGTLSVGAGHGLSDLGPLAQLRAGRLGRRLVQLYAGLLLYGFSIALMVRAHLGLAPWDVLHSGLTKHLPIDIGQALVIVSFVVMLAWIPLREIPGLGTISNAIVIGVSTDGFLAVLPRFEAVPLRALVVVAAIGLQGLATAAYIGAQLGRGPRDGLMTGLARRTGRSLRLVRTAMELTVVVIGLLLGGVAGPATVLYALSIGPISQALLPRLLVAVSPRDVERTVERDVSDGAVRGT